MSKAVARLTAENVTSLMKNLKMYSFLSTSLEKTYIIFEEAKMKLYFKGNKSTVCSTIDISDESVDVTGVALDLDIQKFLNAVKKVQTAEGDVAITIIDSPARVVVSSTSKPDKIALSAKVGSDQDAEIKAVLEFYSDNEAKFEDGTVITATDELLDFSHAAGSLIASMNKANSIALFDNKIMYSDRLVILSSFTDGIVSGLGEDNFIALPTNILNFMQLASLEGAQFVMDQQKRSMLWCSDANDGFWAILSVEAPNAAVFTESEIASVVPTEDYCQTMLIEPTAFIESIEFFNGLFEAGVNKPITFEWSKDEDGVQQMKLVYRHPLTEVEKLVDGASFIESVSPLVKDKAEMTLVFDIIRVLLSRLFCGEGVLKFKFSDRGPKEANGVGAHLVFEDQGGNVKCSAVLAKLIEG